MGQTSVGWRSVRDKAMSQLGNTATHPAAGSQYVLGHSERELERLQTQARILEPFTRQLLIDAGLRPGMRVHDVGCGPGDVAFLAAELVGEAGQVVGTDRSADALSIATVRASERGLWNVSFQEGDSSEIRFESQFDALIGRAVLMFQRDPATMLSRLVAHVRPGGVVAFHEIDWANARSFPTVPSWTRCCELIVATLKVTGADPYLGMNLHSLFIGAGLPPPSLRYVSRIGGAREHVLLVTNLLSTLLPEAERLGLVTPGEIDPSTLLDRVLADVTACGSVVIGWSELGAWSTVAAHFR
jgi:2-polyprenyl-3-methyl-5-hydroxy-6-metoxy-1,4-benzoquinol methylase